MTTPKKKKIIVPVMSFDTGRNDEYLMTCNKMTVGFNMPPASHASFAADGTEIALRLPPRKQRRAFLVDRYPACPEDWMRSSGTLSSYFVAVEQGAGMWLDFNHLNTPYHVACVISIQGMNAITGLPCEDEQLEQYVEECPKHKTKFGHGRLCEKCGFKWPKQNYLCTTGTPDGLFWLDGFRAADGVVRQYIITQERMKGVAQHKLGGKQVYAIGISFFLSKDKRPAPPPSPLRGASDYSWGHYLSKKSFSGTLLPEISNCDEVPIGAVNNTWEHTSDTDTSLNMLSDGHVYSSHLDETKTSARIGSKGITKCAVSHAAPSASLMHFSDDKEGKLGAEVIRKLSRASGQSHGIKPGVLADSVKSVHAVKTKKLEIGQGARIGQEIYDDPMSLDFWLNKPEATIVINYAIESDCRKIIEAGEVDVDGSKEGFLEGIPSAV